MLNIYVALLTADGIKTPHNPINLLSIYAYKFLLIYIVKLIVKLIV